MSLKALKANIKDQQLRKRSLLPSKKEQPLGKSSYLTSKKVVLSPVNTQYNYPWQQPWQQPFNATWHPHSASKIPNASWTVPSSTSPESRRLLFEPMAYNSMFTPSANSSAATLLPESVSNAPSSHRSRPSSAARENIGTPTAITSPPRSRFKSGDSVRFLEPELDQVEERSQSSFDSDEEGGKKNKRHREQVMHRTATSFGIKGGRSVEEALTRNRVSFERFETFSPEEMTRMYRVFRLFRQQDASEVLRSDIPDILIHLGYFIATEEEVDSIVHEVSEFSTFDFQEVVVVAERCAERERKHLQGVFENFADPMTDAMETKDLMEALRTLGAMPLQSVVDECLMEADLEEKEQLEAEDFFRFLAIWRVTEGFRKEEVLEAQVVFRRFANPGNSDSPRTPLQRDIKVTKIRPALQAMFSPHCTDHVSQLLDRLDFGEEARHASEGEDSPDVYHADLQGVSFHEFLVFCRRVKVTILEEIQSVVGLIDREGTECIPFKSLPVAMARLNFSLFRPATEEFLAAIDHEPGADLTFDDFVNFVQECRRCSGFTQAEMDNLADVFRRFDHNDNGYVESLELLDLLRYLGYTTSLEDVRRFLAQADPHASSITSMDLTEFLRRMRLFREEEIQSVRQTFNAHCDPNTGTLALEKTLTALTNSGNMPRAEVLGAALRAAGDLAALSFEDFMGVVDHCREQTVAEKRKRAGFSEKSYRQICSLFNKHKKKGQDTLGKGELLWFLIEIGVPVSTREERAEVFGLLDKGRQSALHAGLTAEEVGVMEESSMTLWGLLHLLRLVVRSGESKDVENEERAMDTTGFLRSELQEFRSIFETWVRREASVRGPLLPQGGAAVATTRRSSLPHIFGDDSKGHTGSGSAPTELTDLLGADEREGRLTIEAMEMLLRSIGLRLDNRQEQMLRARASQVAHQDDNTLSFADFLVLMRWMLDTNFADINEQSERIADRMTRVTARGQAPERVVNAVSPSGGYRRGSI